MVPPIPSAASKHVGCLQFGAVTNEASVSIRVRVFRWTEALIDWEGNY